MRKLSSVGTWGNFWKASKSLELANVYIGYIYLVVLAEQLSGL